MKQKSFQHDYLTTLKEHQAHGKMHLGDFLEEAKKNHSKPIWLDSTVKMMELSKPSDPSRITYPSAYRLKYIPNQYTLDALNKGLPLYLDIEASNKCFSFSDFEQIQEGMRKKQTMYTTLRAQAGDTTETVNQVIEEVSETRPSKLCIDQFQSPAVYVSALWTPAVEEFTSKGALYKFMDDKPPFHNQITKAKYNLYNPLCDTDPQMLFDTPNKKRKTNSEYPEGTPLRNLEPPTQEEVKQMSCCTSFHKVPFSQIVASVKEGLLRTRTLESIPEECINLENLESQTLTLPEPQPIKLQSQTVRLPLALISTTVTPIHESQLSDKDSITSSITSSMIANNEDSQESDNESTLSPLTDREVGAFISAFHPSPYPKMDKLIKDEIEKPTHLCSLRKCHFWQKDRDRYHKTECSFSRHQYKFQPDCKGQCDDQYNWVDEAIKSSMELMHPKSKPYYPVIATLDTNREHTKACHYTGFLYTDEANCYDECTQYYAPVNTFLFRFAPQNIHQITPPPIEVNLLNPTQVESEMQINHQTPSSAELYDEEEAIDYELYGDEPENRQSYSRNTSQFQEWGGPDIPDGFPEQPLDFSFKNQNKRPKTLKLPPPGIHRFHKPSCRYIGMVMATDPDCLGDCDNNSPSSPGNMGMLLNKTENDCATLETGPPPTPTVNKNRESLRDLNNNPVQIKRKSEDLEQTLEELLTDTTGTSKRKRKQRKKKSENSKDSDLSEHFLLNKAQESKLKWGNKPVSERNYIWENQPIIVSERKFRDEPLDSTPEAEAEKKEEIKQIMYVRKSKQNMKKGLSPFTNQKPAKKSPVLKKDNEWVTLLADCYETVKACESEIQQKITETSETPAEVPTVPDITNEPNTQTPSHSDLTDLTDPIIEKFIDIMYVFAEDIPLTYNNDPEKDPETKNVSEIQKKIIAEYQLKTRDIKSIFGYMSQILRIAKDPTTAVNAPTKIRVRANKSKSFKLDELDIIFQELIKTLGVSTPSVYATRITNPRSSITPAITRITNKLAVALNVFQQFSNILLTVKTGDPPRNPVPIPADWYKHVEHSDLQELLEHIKMFNENIPMLQPEFYETKDRTTMRATWRLETALVYLAKTQQYLEGNIDDSSSTEDNNSPVPENQILKTKQYMPLLDCLGRVINSITDEKYPPIHRDMYTLMDINPTVTPDLIQFPEIIIPASPDIGSPNPEIKDLQELNFQLQSIMKHYVRAKYLMHAGDKIRTFPLPQDWPLLITAKVMDEVLYHLREILYIVNSKNQLTLPRDYVELTHPESTALTWRLKCTLEHVIEIQPFLDFKVTMHKTDGLMTTKEMDSVLAYLQCMHTTIRCLTNEHLIPLESKKLERPTDSYVKDPEKKFWDELKKKEERNYKLKWLLTHIQGVIRAANTTEQIATILHSGRLPEEWPYLLKEEQMNTVLETLRSMMYITTSRLNLELPRDYKSVSFWRWGEILALLISLPPYVDATVLAPIYKEKDDSLNTLKGHQTRHRYWCNLGRTYRHIQSYFLLPLSTKVRYKANPNNQN